MTPDIADSNESEEDDKYNIPAPPPPILSSLLSIKLTLPKPMCIVFKLLPNPQNFGVRIKSLPTGALSRILKIEDVMLSVDNESTSCKNFT